MNKAELNQAVEKASSQTKLEAMRVLDTILGGVKSDALAKEKPERRMRPKSLSLDPEKDQACRRTQEKPSP